MPHLDYLFIAFLCDTLETFIWFTFKFEDEGLILEMLAETKLEIYILIINDENKGALKSMDLFVWKIAVDNVFTHNAITKLVWNETVKYYKKHLQVLKL